MTTDPALAIDPLVAVLGIKQVDVAIANAGTTGSCARVDGVALDELTRVMQVDTWSHLLLFQSMTKLGLLGPGAKFLVAGSSMGSIAGMERRPFLMRLTA